MGRLEATHFQVKPKLVINPRLLDRSYDIAQRFAWLEARNIDRW